MNLLFWRKKDTPAPPVMKLSEIERALIEDFDRSPEAWTVRKWNDGAIRTDRGPTAIVTVWVRDRPCAQAFWANSGPTELSHEFAGRWHDRVVARQAANQRAEQAKAREAVLEGLTRQFLK